MPANAYMEGNDTALMNNYRIDPMSRTNSVTSAPDLEANCEIVTSVVGMGRTAHVFHHGHEDHRNRHAPCYCTSVVDGS